MKRFRNILVAVDTRFEEHPALDWATRLAEHNRAQLKIVDVLPDSTWLTKLALADSESTQNSIAELKRQRLEALGEPIRATGLDVTTCVLSGKTSYAITCEVLRASHDLVVRVTKGARSPRTGVFGTTSMRLLRQCPCPVWLVRVDKRPSFKRVLTAIDPAPKDINQEVMNRTIIELGKSIAEYEHGELHIVHVWEIFGEHLLKSRCKPSELAAARKHAESCVAAALDACLLPHGLSHDSEHVHTICEELGPGHAIAELSKREQIDLVVMGTIARTGLVGAFLGNTAEQVLDRIECSVLAIKPEKFISPVTWPDP